MPTPPQLTFWDEDAGYESVDFLCPESGGVPKQTPPIREGEFQPLLNPPKFADYAWVVILSSGGKDSQTSLRQIVLEAQRQKYPPDRLVVSHQELGRMEWPGTSELAARQAAHYGLRFETSRYRDKHGEEPDLLEYARRRGKWPSNAQRWCTSEFKRAPGNRILTKLSKERKGPILQAFGFRSEESPARAKRHTLAVNVRITTANRPVIDWLPIHHWTEKEVWDDIRESGVPYHHAYDLGMKRLSCIFCVFAPKCALICAGIANPKLLDEYIQTETEIGHDFQHNKPLRLIRDAIRAGEKPSEADDGAWNM